MVPYNVIGNEYRPAGDGERIRARGHCQGRYPGSNPGMGPTNSVNTLKGVGSETRHKHDKQDILLQT